MKHRNYFQIHPNKTRRPDIFKSHNKIQKFQRSLPCLKKIVIKIDNFASAIAQLGRAAYLANEALRMFIGPAKLNQELEIHICKLKTIIGYEDTFQIYSLFKDIVDKNSPFLNNKFVVDSLSQAIIYTDVLKDCYHGYLGKIIRKIIIIDKDSALNGMEAAFIFSNLNVPEHQLDKIAASIMTMANNGHRERDILHTIKYLSQYTNAYD